jgi:uncharacterized membrane protein
LDEAFVKVELNYDPPGGIIGKGIAKLFGDDPEQQVYEGQQHT